MAFKKTTIRQQFTDALAPVLEPGEQVRAGAYTVSGPSPWLTGAIGIVLMLVLGMRYYYLAVTDRRVLFMRASLLSQRPKGLAFAYPVSSVSIAGTTVATLWSNFKLQRPGGKPIRLNFHKIWRDEMQQIARAIESAPRSQQAAAAPSRCHHHHRPGASGAAPTGRPACARWQARPWSNPPTPARSRAP